MSRMTSVIVTGSTRGIGYGLADALLSLGCAVTVSGRNQKDVDQAAANLSRNHKPGNILGIACDVTRFEQVQTLWDATKTRTGRVDIWINNAGLSHPTASLWEQTPEVLRQVIETNVIGAVYGSAVAVQGMLRQGFGSIYNMEGMGSDGRRVRGVTLYGTTKYALAYLTDALVEETKGTAIIVGAIRPGMVITDLLTKPLEGRPEAWERARPIFNILAERVETVTPWLARQILANKKPGVRIRWLTPQKMIGKFLFAPFRKRDLFN